MSIFKQGWYLIYTKPRHEKKVFDRLVEQRITSYLPTRKSLRSWHDRKKYIDEPLFPSYVFIYLNDLEHYFKGMNTDGALYFVKTGKEIARVSDPVVDNIKLAISQPEEIEVSETYFQPGQRLVIKQGPLTGLSCEVVQSNSRKKLLVRVELLQRNLLVTVSDDLLMAL